MHLRSLSTEYSGQSENQYKFNVKMTCSGCSNAINRVLTKAKDDPSAGVSDFTVKLDEQEVTVKGTASYDDVYARIAKTGKQIISGETL
ncbi:copper chaperone taha [Flagelloscypha sp. PMI_526]|nr:copper chaperone taha [Flagelloscypha sp. PMI_526]